MGFMLLANKRKSDQVVESIYLGFVLISKGNFFHFDYVEVVDSFDIHSDRMDAVYDSLITRSL